MAITSTGNSITSKRALVLHPHEKAFNFIDKWNHPLWKCCGAYMWSIEQSDGYLVSYVGQVFGDFSNFDIRIWEEFKWWKSGNDRPVNIEAYKSGIRRELPAYPPGHLQRELDEFKPTLRLWLIPLPSADACDQAEKWLVSELCKTARSRQFLANCDPDSYRPDPNWPVRIDAPPSFRIIGLTVHRAAARP